MPTPSVSDFNPRLVLKRKKLTVSYFRERLDDSTSFEMMQIPAGQFKMGSPSTEMGHDESEEPRHEVDIQEFWLGKYPVTQAEWTIVSQLPQVDIELKSHPAQFSGEKRPVESISWHEAVEYCKRLSNSSKRTYRLPTEAEWEYACRAGTATPFHFGETITSDLVNYRGTKTYNDGPKGECREETTDVGTFPPNAFGLHDMHGNVWEWCVDNWHENYKGALVDGQAWIEGGNNNLRVLRGGSWGDDPENCRSAYRGSYTPLVRDGSIGFRIVCEF